MHKKGLSIEAGCGQVIRLISARHAGLDPASSNERSKKALDSPSTLLRVVSVSNHGSSPE
jgi:hypothetical protein